MDRQSGRVEGNEEIFILCEKVNKKEIKVRFFELDQEGNQVWESFGSFAESDVHHQVAIVFRTPSYHDEMISHPVTTFVQLYRPKDGEYSEARPFVFLPKGFLAPPSPMITDQCSSPSFLPRTSSDASFNRLAVSDKRKRFSSMTTSNHSSMHHNNQDHHQQSNRPPSSSNMENTDNNTSDGKDVSFITFD